MSPFQISTLANSDIIHPFIVLPLLKRVVANGYYEMPVTHSRCCLPHWSKYFIPPTWLRIRAHGALQSLFRLFVNISLPLHVTCPAQSKLVVRNLIQIRQAAYILLIVNSYLFI